MFRIRLNNLYVSAKWNDREDYYRISVSTDSSGCSEFDTRAEAQSFLDRFVKDGRQYRETADAEDFFVEPVTQGSTR